ncbi:NAD(P)-binding protein [Neurospora crassa]|uniref:Short-chain dehydrogenase srdE n=1 Tax=Neurospora crassa (strain ATCC 24698 / 74-OR23-1A / CBS 708.71 / DSM 1257 / FGSC 987) TaxID=367110 RepID=SRDE_NEUCR|nr:short-chain dehydrogenase/reductase [Neurospora crassa OR74A]Q7SHI2.1 RecName: Full=Short-chain dehydrogenase srdE; AltName: Full=Sordarial biosynthesis cluster protein srdE [Neurospora crassa OR74A]EAA36368.1 short-chain dehydrogenase/reductase [Neurospora crassa OR74A]KHE89305.1 NAD(P)-binding protein [Neurospora crassa]|eukprot:XP_965604.1 short-chain dehydrogenase/reductase [Neurospora crassa OR74A]
MAPQSTKFALITGCGAGGIGEALILEYLRRGIHPIATLLPFESSEHLDKAGITWFKLDVTNEESVVQLKKDVSELTKGRLDFLVNNAGICYTMTAIDTDVKSVQRMFDVNLFGPMRMVHHFHDMLIASSGIIVNIGSIGGVVPFVYGSSYNASKAALAHWGNSLRVELAPLGVRVLVIISGEVGTNILKNDHGRTLPEGSYYSPMAEEFKNHVHRTPDAATDRFVYAKNVVGESLKKSPTTWFWTGSYSGVIRFLHTFFPKTVFDRWFSSLFNLAKLKEAHDAAMKKKVA